MRVATRGGAGVAALLICVVLVRACSLVSPCVSTVTHPDFWLLGIVGPVAILLLGSVLLSAGRALWLLRAAGRSVRHLRRVPPPAALEAAVRRTGTGSVECVDSAVPLAFCAGALRPTILVTDGLVQALRPEELEAVLLHERHHQARRDPLRYAGRRAVAEVCFFLPLAGWWALHAVERAELSADRAAVYHMGRRPVAGALWTVAEERMAVGIPAFQGAVELRAAQLLGDPLPRRRPAHAVWLASGVGLAATYGLTACVVQVALAVV